MCYNLQIHTQFDHWKEEVTMIVSTLHIASSRQFPDKWGSFSLWGRGWIRIYTLLFYKNTSLKIRAENNGENNDLLFRTKDNLRTTKPWIQFTWFLQK